MNRINKSVLLIGVVMLSSGCSLFKEIVTVPQYQEVVVIDPAPPSPLSLRNPPILAMTTEQLADDIKKTENLFKIYYVMDQNGIDDMLRDDIDKLEYLQYESRRAEYYKATIHDHNTKTQKRNKELSKK